MTLRLTSPLDAEPAVPAGGPDVSFRLSFNTGGAGRPRWPVVPLSVGPDVVLEMLANLLSARSFVSQQARDDLHRWGLAPAGAGALILRDLRIVGQPVPDLAVRVGPAPRLLAVDGILGFDFFAKFSRIMLGTGTLIVTLVGP